MKLKEWAAFGLLSLIWGSSFLWIKIAVAETTPVTVVGLRLLFGLAGLALVVLWSRTALPRDRSTWLKLVFMGFLNTALPFALITWGETRIDSGLAAILNGTVPLWTIAIAHLFLHDDKISLPRIGGLLAGFAGVVVLVSRDLRGESAFAGGLPGQLAVLGASLCYASAIVFSRRNLRNLNPLVQALGVVLLADAFAWAGALAFESPIQLPAQPVTWLAVAWLGVLGSCLAYILFFHLINRWGPTRASLVTYTMPVIGLALGIVFLNERADWQLLAGAALIFSGILLVSRAPQRAVAARAVSAATETAAD